MLHIAKLVHFQVYSFFKIAKPNPLKVLNRLVESTRNNVDNFYQHEVQKSVVWIQENTVKNIKEVPFNEKCIREGFLLKRNIYNIYVHVSRLLLNIPVQITIAINIYLKKDFSSISECFIAI